MGSTWVATPVTRHCSPRSTSSHWSREFAAATQQPARPSFRCSRAKLPPIWNAFQSHESHVLLTCARAPGYEPCRVRL